MRRILCGALAAILVGTAAMAADVPVEPALNEAIAMVPNNKVLSVKLETTVFKPSGDGPFPVVVINHLNESASTRLADTHFQPRYRPLPAVRQFLQRGYAVVVPMRQGYSNSGGLPVGSGCNPADTGRAHADDVKAVVSWLRTQSWADSSRMLMIGRGQGAWATLAYAANSPEPGFKLFAVFSGALGDISMGGCTLAQIFKGAMTDFGEKTRAPSLWFFADNESAYTPEVLKPAFDAYVAGGAPATLVNFGNFTPDPSAMFAVYRGLSIWWPPIEQRLAAAGMPTAVAHPEFATAGWTKAPPPSGYAAIQDTTKLPFVTEPMLKGYATFLKWNNPRAFAVGPGGAWSWAASTEDPRKLALESCQKKATGPCRLYAVDNDVVWRTDDAPH
jgi:dienelactone hydrolase